MCGCVLGAVDRGIIYTLTGCTALRRRTQTKSLLFVAGSTSPGGSGEHSHQRCSYILLFAVSLFSHDDRVVDRADISLASPDGSYASADA